jgi:hypothetical protein
MRHTQSWSACLGLLLITVSGCAQPPLARYVYQDGEYGVVGIPVNTYHDRLDVRVQAEELYPTRYGMRRFP